ncbi:MAG: helix-turn-helix transcriptional regulator [Lachnospiraceae bacterium]|nr:helix-turn-helix transcriptional regulator [Lachnospiraceae bacterium]
MDQVRIGRFIAELRKERGLTQKQLAEQLGISDKTVSKWECGRKWFSLESAFCFFWGF